jgi:hypothetical protein
MAVNPLLGATVAGGVPSLRAKTLRPRLRLRRFFFGFWLRSVVAPFAGIDAATRPDGRAAGGIPALFGVEKPLDTLGADASAPVSRSSTVGPSNTARTNTRTPQAHLFLTLATD